MILVYYILERLIHIHIDASGIDIGYMLTPVNEDHLKHSVECASRSLSPAERKDAF